MKKIRRNSTVKMRNILKENTWEFFIAANDYKGGLVTKCPSVSSTLEDLKLGHAEMYEDKGRYIVKYAGLCKWVSV